MYDSRLSERVKNYQTSKIDLCRKREQTSLRLRKEKLFDDIMEKRLSGKNELHSNLHIILDTLNVQESYLTEYASTKLADKWNLLKKWYMEESSVCYSDISYLSGEFPVKSTDLKKYCIVKLRELSEELDLSKDKELEFDKEFVQVMVYDLIDSKEMSVKLEISDIFLNLGDNSKNFNEILLDNEYLGRFLELTYLNCFPLLENILIIFGNIMNDFHENVGCLIETIPIVYRLKEIIVCDKYDSYEAIRVYLLYNLKIIAHSIKEDKFIIFVDFIPNFANYFEYNYILNETVLIELLQLLYRLSFDENHMANSFIAHGIAKHLMDLLSRSSISDYIRLIIGIFGNMLNGMDNIEEYLLSLKILEVFDKLIQKYMNSTQKEDTKIIYEIIWTGSNLVAGNTSQVDTVILYSTLPKSIIRINKFKKDSKILSETNKFFYNALVKGSDLCVLEVMKLEISKIFCEAINNSEDVNLIQTALSGIIRLIQKSEELFSSNVNIKNELIASGISNRMEFFSQHKNEKISKSANQILSIMDDSTVKDNESDIKMGNNFEKN